MDPWRLALEQFKFGLTEEEKELFENSKPEDIHRDVADRAKRKSSGPQEFSRRLHPLLAAIEHYGKALDVISNSSPLILCPLWGSLRVLLRVAQEYDKYYSKLLEMLERIGCVLPRYSTYSRLFSKHRPLRQALSSAYLQILTFLTRAKEIFSKSSFRVLSMALWKPFDEEFETLVERLRQSGKEVEDEARLAGMIEMVKEGVLAAEGRRKSDEVKSIIETREQVTNLADIQRWLNARQCEDEIAGVMENRLPDSCEWILDREELSRWIGDDQAQIFWIYGPPGCGKSYLYSKLLDLVSEHNPLYFFFCGADKERTAVSSLVRSWSLQLIQHFLDPTVVLDAIRNTSRSRKATCKEVFDLFPLLLERSPSCYLTVDALDECPDKEQFFRLLSTIPTRFKILVLSREDADIRNGFSQYSRELVHLSIEPGMTEADIDYYIANRLKSRDALYGTQVSEKIRQKLTQCDGMFLWVRLMFEHIQSQTSEFEILQCLDELPTGLDNTYKRILDRINGLPPPQQRLAHKVFFWVTIVRRPVSVAEMCGLLATQLTSNEFDESRLVLDAENLIMSVCGSLVRARYRERKIYPVHFTVTEYLKDYLGESKMLQKLTSYYDARELKSSESLAAAVCIRYLSLSFIGALQKPTNGREVAELLSNQEPRFALLEYAALNWFEHLRDVESPEPLLFDLVREFSNHAHPNLDICWHIYWFSGSDSDESTICPPNSSGLPAAAYFDPQSVTQGLRRALNRSGVDYSGRSALWWSTSCFKLARAFVGITLLCLVLTLAPNKFLS
ncbi:MAG: hypothetical protein M1839_002755 [Geoglossum umbratile]|nr:MAG: hypothetical protein M1839_002755 [Geoglossum umbratile]